VSLQCTLHNGSEGACKKVAECLNFDFVSPDDIITVEHNLRQCPKLEICCSNTNATKSQSQLFSNPRRGIGAPADKISMGKKAIINEFPWAVLLGYKVKGKTEFLCGGSLIESENFKIVRYSFYS
jgi:hypothetical protein